jgi:gluconolactonase
MLELSSLRTLATGLDHPEAVTVSPDGYLYAGGEAGQIYRVDPSRPAGDAEQVADTRGMAQGIACDARSRLYVCDSERHAILRVSGDGVDTYCDSAGGQPLVFPNYAAFDRDGSLWFSDSGEESLDVVEGRLIRVPAGGGDGEVAEIPRLHFSNGLCVRPDGVVYLLESFRPRLHAFADGELTTVAELPGVVPDGLALDQQGGLIIACYYPFRLLYLRAGHTVPVVLLDDPMGLRLQMPCNVAFFGDGLTELAISALGGHNISAVTPEVPGQALHYPTFGGPG